MIPLIKVDVGGDELEAVKKVLESGYLAQGPTAKRFEQEFAAYAGVKHASATTSCTAALQLAVASLGLGRGDEVIVPSFTFPASANAVAREGAKPVFCDIDLRSYNIDASQAGGLVTERTKAIMPVHLFGQPADMDAVNALAKKRGLRVIEDAACAAGTLYKGKHVGGFGDFGCFSFHPRKVLTTGEGGMITTNDDCLAEIASSLKDHGKAFADGKMFFKRRGFNYRMSDILAAIGIVQLKKLDSTIKRRRELAGRYAELLEDVEGVVPPIRMPYGNHTFQSYVMLIERKEVRDRVIALLKEKGIEVQVGTYAVHLQPAYASEKTVLPNAENAFENTLTLPLYARMTEAEQETVVNELKNAIKKV